jgi:hypothetical protein
MNLRDKIADIIAHSFSRERTHNSNLAADAILSLPEMKEIMGNADRYNSIKELFPEFLVRQDEIKEWKEKAEKWDAYKEDIEIEVAECNIRM